MMIYRIGKPTSPNILKHSDQSHCTSLFLTFSVSLSDDEEHQFPKSPYHILLHNLHLLLWYLCFLLPKCFYHFLCIQMPPWSEHYFVAIQTRVFISKTQLRSLLLYMFQLWKSLLRWFSSPRFLSEDEVLERRKGLLFLGWCYVRHENWSSSRP